MSDEKWGEKYMQMMRVDTSPWMVLPVLPMTFGPLRTVMAMLEDRLNECLAGDAKVTIRVVMDATEQADR